jgi:hypothetical protein
LPERGREKGTGRKGDVEKVIGRSRRIGDMERGIRVKEK